MDGPVDLTGNARRFEGFADLYDEVRPTPPLAVANLVLAYLGQARAGLVVDLGSGTGLSSRWASRWAERVVGVEPSDDMRRRATERPAGAPGGGTGIVSYLPGWGHQIGLGDGCADVVLAVQSLHWMEPSATFAEAARVLRPGGVFVSMDCDFPPLVGNPQAEAAWGACFGTVQAVEQAMLAREAVAGGSDPTTGTSALAVESDRTTGTSALAVESDRTTGTSALPGGSDRTTGTSALPGGSEPTAGASALPGGSEPTAGASALPGGVRSWSKQDHLARLVACRRFRWCRELAAQSVERGDHRRFVALFRSLGHLQQVLAAGCDEEKLGLPEFEDIAAATLGSAPRAFWFTYWVRLAVK